MKSKIKNRQVKKEGWAIFNIKKNDIADQIFEKEREAMIHLVISVHEITNDFEARQKLYKNYYIIPIEITYKLPAQAKK